MLGIVALKLPHDHTIEPTASHMCRYILVYKIYTAKFAKRPQKTNHQYHWMDLCRQHRSWNDWESAVRTKTTMTLDVKRVKKEDTAQTRK